MKASRAISSDAGSSPMPWDSRSASLEERSLGCDLVLCTTALRARQTLEIVRPVPGSPEVRFDDAMDRFTRGYSTSAFAMSAYGSVE